MFIPPEHRADCHQVAGQSGVRVNYNAPASPPMLLVARKNLLNERIRLAISVGGVALSVFLIGILLALFRGWDEKVGEYVEEVPADLWVASEGATDFIQAASVLPASAGTQLRLLPEIETASPLIVRPLQMSKAGDDPDDEIPPGEAGIRFSP